MVKDHSDSKRKPTATTTYPFQLAARVHLYASSQGRKEDIFYLMTHSTHFIYGYMVSEIW